MPPVLGGWLSLVARRRPHPSSRLTPLHRSPAGTWGFDFYQWLAWVGIWVGIYMTLLAAFDASA